MIDLMAGSLERSASESTPINLGGNLLSMSSYTPSLVNQMDPDQISPVQGPIPW